MSASPSRAVDRFDRLRRLLLAAGASALAACQSMPGAPRPSGPPPTRDGSASPGLPADEAPAPALARHLDGEALVLLGEVHDHAALHARRLGLLRQALDRGWRPAVAMEQFDTDRQADLERARRERPGDVGHLIRAAAPAQASWDWRLYEPVIALVLEADLPLVAADLSRAEARRVVREGQAAVPPAVDAGWQSTMQAEIEAGHCGQLPAALLPGMAGAQFARDRTMARVLQAAGEGRGAVLLAGNGHVRRDLAVPRWLDAAAARRAWCVGFLEEGESLPRVAFDAVVTAPAQTRERDPCESLQPRG